jgi:GT2 family glycosyltransferase/glycosyltransferase involved in cell wall biosynthesis
MALFLRRVREILIPRNSFQARIASFIFHWLQGQKISITRRKRKAVLTTLLDTNSRQINCKEIDFHKEPIDVIICVHNALDDVRKCLESVQRNTTDPFSLIIVDDGSDEQTEDYLTSFVKNEPRSKLIRNDTAKGYTLAANQGMRASDAPFLVLLNSDTIVGPQWIDRMYRAITVEKNIGVAGPLSNTASWQSIPELSVEGDWATNTLPPNTSATEMSKLITKYSACIIPEVPLLNGFCMMIRKAAIDGIGYFDEDTFGQGYGEEDDFNLRAGKAGWKKVIADDVYIYHAQSKSYSNQRRMVLAQQSGEKLQKKHGVNLIADSVAFMNPNRVMEGIRSRTNIMLERENILEQGRAKYSGKKLLFLLPVIDAGGGANVIIDEARSMIEMGVDVRIFNLAEYKTAFIQNYPRLDIPLVFGNTNDLIKIASQYDAIVASANYSVEWLKPLQNLNNIPTLGYYIQGFEPLMYPKGSKEAETALETYSMLHGCKRFTKTEWTRRMVFEHAKVESDVVGISVNIDLFRPRDMMQFCVKPVTIVAMVRPGSPYRNPEMTLKIMKQISSKYGKDVDIWFFGANEIRDVVDQKYLDFRWNQLGKLTQHQVALMMSKADIFADFSSHQAMGLSALEAMSAGCSVIVPQNGGAIEFVHDRKNGIVTDTSNFEESLHALEELVEDDDLRKRLQLAAIKDVVQYYPEKASFNILKSLLG